MVPRLQRHQKNHYQMAVEKYLQHNGLNQNRINHIVILNRYLNCKYQVQPESQQIRYRHHQQMDLIVPED